jgi:class 3 adenylate cyclase/tetratricopeptide (TPR) repeat protein
VGLVCGSCGAELADGDRFCSSCGAAVAGAARETRRVVTALFSDVVGSTALGERLDPEDFRELVGGAVARMASSVEAFGGEVFEYAGDGLLALFGAPTAHEDDPERAVLAGLRIIESIDSYREQAAREWDVEGFAVRVGIETGLAVLGRVGGGTKLEYGAVGDSLNTAARLQGEAEPGMVLVGPRTGELVGDRFELGAARALTLKGKAGVVEARPVLAPRAAIGGAGAVTADLVGRERELAAGLEHVDDVLGGSGRILIVSGEAGVGKSRLVGEIRRRFEAGSSPGGKPRWLEGRCVSYGESLPYWPFRGLLREWLADASAEDVGSALDSELTRIAPERADELRPALEAALGLALDEAGSGSVPAEAAQQRIRDGVAEALELLAAEGPLAISLDDLHWADASSLALTGRLLELAERAPVLLLLNLRPERDHPAWALREEALRTSAHRAREIALEPLGGDVGRELLAALVGAETLPAELERRLLDRAEGNPFYLEELVRSMVDSGSLRRSNGEWSFDREVPVDIPETVEKVVLARIDRLSPPAQELVGVAAVLGRQFPVPLLEVVSQPAELDDPLRELQAAELLRDAQRWPVPFVAFTHTLIQEAAYRGLLKRRRQELHAAAVAAIEGMYAERLDEFAGMAAHHAASAGDHRGALDLHRRAASAAERVYALAEAAEHCTAALAAAAELQLDESDDVVRELFASRGRDYFMIGDLEPARADLERAQAAAEAYGDAETRAQAALDLAGYWRSADFRKATELMEEIAADGDALPAGVRINVLARLAIQYVNELRFDRAAETADEALALAEDRGDELAVAQALDAQKLVALHVGDIDRLEAITTRLRRTLEAQFDEAPRDTAYYLSWVLLESGFVPLARGDHDAAIALFTEALELTRKMGARFQEALFVDALCWAHRSKGDYARAIELGHEAVELAPPAETVEWSSWVHATLGWTLLEAGDAATAAETLERGLETAREGRAPAQILRCTALLAWARAELGDVDAARSLRGECAQLLETVGIPPGGAWLFGAHVYVAAGRVDLALGEPQRAIELLQPIAAAAERSGWIEALNSATALIGEAATASPRG